MSATGPRAKATARQRWNKPTAIMLPRFGDSLSFLYLDIMRVVQDDTGVDAVVEAPGGGEQRVAIPTAALSCLLLGPGTSITARALGTLARHGTTVLCVGVGGVRCYAAIAPTDTTSRWLELQARGWADDATRLAVAKRMYALRFGTPPADATTIDALRGHEGDRMKALYKTLAQAHHVPAFRRSYDPNDWDTQTPVNRALSAGNSCLYGIAHAAINALGCSPGLGFVHTGTTMSFVRDIADLYKAEHTLPLAFSLHTSDDPEGEARRSFREKLRLVKLLPRIVADVQNLLDPDADTRERLEDAEDSVAEMANLWDPERGWVAGGVNYGGTEAS
ncbi:type I-E CRISPR-associated endonuclease Cas1e [Embleya sp. NPDC056575]|uniref:type I-E CRISPR-associated endonuclease Cas1e n=1 Tax=unclassified Embleya TaxID=2699296 RepID=UPI003696C462